KRLFVCKSTKLGLVSDFDIVPWQRVENLSFKEGILGAQVTVVQQNEVETTVKYIPKKQARKLYKAGMEALRVSALHVEKTGVDGAVLPPLTDHPADELTLKLQKLKSLFERDLITEAEYEQ